MLDKRIIELISKGRTAFELGRIWDAKEFLVSAVKLAKNEEDYLERKRCLISIYNIFTFYRRGWRAYELFKSIVSLDIDESSLGFPAATPIRSDPKVVEFDFLAHSVKEWVSVGISQIGFSVAYNDKQQCYFIEDVHSQEEKIISVVEQSIEKGVDIICFPELSIAFERYFTLDDDARLKDSFFSRLLVMAEEANIFIFPGTLYSRRGSETQSVAPLIFGRHGVRLIGKSNPSKYESFLDSGMPLKIFHTEYGILCIVVCYDFLVPSIMSEILRNKLDFLFGITFNPQPDDFVNQSDLICRRKAGGIYCVLCNCSSDTGERYGRSSFFGQMRKDWKEKQTALAKKHSISPRNGTSMLCEVAPSEECIIMANFNLLIKNVTISTPIVEGGFENIRIKDKIPL